MLTFPQFIDEVNATLPGLLGAAAGSVRFAELSPDEVEWNVGSDAVRAARQSQVGAMLIPYRNGRRHGPMEVVAMDPFGIEAVCTLIADHCGSDGAPLP